MKKLFSLIAAGMLVPILMAAEPSSATTPKPYPLDKCLVMGGKIDLTKEQPTLVYEGRTFIFCCQGCVDIFKQNPEPYVKKFDEAWKKVRPYPLKRCLVSGEELGSMGKPVAIVYKGQELKFCCKGCVKAFLRQPDQYLAKLPKQPKR